MTDLAPCLTIIVQGKEKNDAWMGVDSLCAPTESDDSDDKVDNRELLES